MNFLFVFFKLHLKIIFIFLFYYSFFFRSQILDCFINSVLVLSNQRQKIIHVLPLLGLRCSSHNGTFDAPSVSSCGTFETPSVSPCGTFETPSASPCGTFDTPSVSPSRTSGSPSLTNITGTQNTLSPCSDTDPNTKIRRKKLHCCYHESYLLSALLSTPPSSAPRRCQSRNTGAWWRKRSQSGTPIKLPKPAEVHSELREQTIGIGSVHQHAGRLQEQVHQGRETSNFLTSAFTPFVPVLLLIILFI